MNTPHNFASQLGKKDESVLKGLLHPKMNILSLITYPHAKKTKITTLFNNLSPLRLLRVTVAPFWRVSAGRKQRMLFCVSRYGDAAETNCWIKSLFLFSLRRKGVLVTSLNSDWTTDGKWTILTMSFLLFWALTVLFTWQSMGQSQASRFSSKIS